MKNQQKFEFKYEGENFIDLNTLITSQFHFLATVHHLQKELYPHVDLKIKVGAFKEGSFIVDLMVESSWVESLFNKENLTVVGSIISAFAGIVKIHSFLKGKKSDSIERKGDGNITIKVEGDDNVVIVSEKAFDIYTQNGAVAKSIQQNFELLKEDQEIQGIQIKEQGTKDEPILKVGREDFSALAETNAYLSKSTMDDVLYDQILFIKKANLQPDKKRNWKWDFFHKNRDITAIITDWSFAERINDGERIGQGDRLKVDLKIKLKYSSDYATWIEAGHYEVIKVHELIPRPEQSKLF